MCAYVWEGTAAHCKYCLSSFLWVAWHQMASLSEEQLRSLTSPHEAMCRDVKEAPPFLHVALLEGVKVYGPLETR